MLLTPLLLDFSNKLLPQFPKVDVPTSPEELLLLAEPQLSSPSYFIKIYFPSNINQPSGLRQPELQFNIPNDPQLHNKVRLTLPASIGHGVNSCYKIEYWSYQRPFEPGKLPRFSKVQKTKLAEEYWRVPTPDKTYLLSYGDLQNYKLGNCTSTITLTRDWEMDSLLDNLDVISIVSIKDSEQEYTAYQVVDNSLLPKLPLTAPQLTIGVQWQDGEAAPTEDYQLTYINPLGLEDILYVDLQETTVLSSYLLNAFYIL